MMEATVYEGSRKFMRGVCREPVAEELTELQMQILEVLSDGELYTMGELASRLGVAMPKLIYDLDELSVRRPIYEENRGRRFWIGILGGKHEKG